MTCFCEEDDDDDDDDRPLDNELHLVVFNDSKHLTWTNTNAG